MAVASKLTLEIEIKAKLAELQGLTAELRGLREQAVGGVQGLVQQGGAIQSAFAGGSAAAQRTARDLEQIKRSAEETASGLERTRRASDDLGRGLASGGGGDGGAAGEREEAADSRIEHLTERVSQLTERLQSAAKESGHMGDELEKSGALGLAAAGAIALGLSQIPPIIEATIGKGVTFDAQVETAALGIGAALRQVQPDRIYDFNEAMRVSGHLVDELKIKAAASSSTFDSLLAGWQGNVANFYKAGISNLTEQLDLIVKIGDALQLQNIKDPGQVLQETRSLITGEVGPDATLATQLGLTGPAIKAAIESGTYLQILKDKLQGVAEAGERVQGTLNGAMSTLDDNLTQLSGKIAEPTFDALRKGVIALNTELGRPESAAALATLSQQIAGVVGGGVQLVAMTTGAAAVLAPLAQAALAVGIALGTWRLAPVIVQLVRWIGTIPQLLAGLSLERAALGGSTAAELQLASTRAQQTRIIAGEQAAVARLALTQLEATGTATQLALAEARLALSTAEAGAASAATAAQTARLAAINATSTAAFVSRLGLVLGIAALVGTAIWQWKSALDAANSSLDETRKKNAATLRETRESIAAANTAAKLATVQTGIVERIKEVVKALQTVEEKEGSISGLFNRGLDRFISGGASTRYTREHDELVKQYQALRQQLDTSEKLAGIDQVRFQLQLESARQAEAQAATDTQRTVAKQKMATFEKNVSDEIAAIERSINTQRRGGSALSSEQLEKAKLSRDVLKEFLAQTVGAQRAAEMVALALQRWPELLGEAASAAKKAAAEFASVRFDAMQPDQQMDDLLKRRGESYQKFLDIFQGSTQNAIPGSAPAMNQGVEGMAGVIDSEPDPALKAKLQEQAVEVAKVSAEYDKLAKTVNETASSQRHAREHYDALTRSAEATAAGSKELGDQIKYEAEVIKEATAEATAQNITYAEAEQIVRRRKNAELGAAEATKDLKKETSEAAAEAKRLARETERLTEAERQRQIDLVKAKASAVESDPTLTREQKDRILFGLLEEEARLLAESKARWEAYNQAAAGSKDPDVLGKVRENRRKIDQADQRQVGIEQQKRGLTAGGKMEAGLVSQIDDLGGAAENAAKAFSGSLQTAIGGCSNAILALALRTGNWKQAMSQAMQSGISELIQLGVRTAAHYAMLGAKMLAHADLGSLLKQKDTAETVQQSATKVASLTPAALLESVTTYGIAAAVGAAALLAAFALMGGFERGGPTGGREGQVAGVVHGEEYVLNAPATRAVPRAFLDALNARQVRVAGYERGGYVGGGGDVRVADFAASAEQSRQSAAPQVSVGGPSVNVVAVRDEAEARRELLNSGEFDHAVVQRLDRHGVVRRRS